MVQFDFNNPVQIKTENSRVWFAACVPLIAVFVEAFSANSFRLGVLVWVTAVISMYAACIADVKYLKKQEFGVKGLSPLIIIPPLYVFRRAKLTRSSAAPCIVMVILILYASVINGFSQAAAMSDDDKLDYVRASYVQSISGLDASGISTIDQKLTEYVGEDKEIEWTESEKSGRITVTAECGKFKIVLTVPFDGYAFGDITVSELTVDGKKYEGDELKDKLNEIFIGDSDSSSEKENGSNSEYTKA